MGRISNVILALLFLTPTLFIFSISAHAIPVANNQTSLDSFLPLVRRSVMGDSEKEKRLSKIENSFAFVFIPGILGSKLTKNIGGKKRIIWGEDSPSAEDLALFHGERDWDVKAEVLTDYSVFDLSRQDVYGRFYQAIEQARNGYGAYVEFPYDWRLDIGVNAGLLDNFLRNDSRLKGKNIILIAHSMGGVLAWAWQNDYYKKKNKRNIRVKHIYLLGAPLAGACEILSMVINGYRPIPDAGVFEKISYSILFDDLRSAAFTFPSVFELMPKVPSDVDDSCMPVPLLRNSDPGKELPANYFSHSWWKDSQLGSYLLNKPWDDIGITKQKFHERFSKVLETAKNFRDRFTLTKINIPTTIFYSNRHKTVRKIFISLEADSSSSYEIEEIETIRDGDGRVLADS